MTTPAAPVPSATPGDQKLTVTWAAVTATPAVTKYMVRKGSGAWGSVGTALTKTFTGLKNGTSVTIQVAAVNADGQGAPGTTAGTPVDDGTTSNDNGWTDSNPFANPGLAVKNLDWNDPDD
jgi:hypothetical protein